MSFCHSSSFSKIQMCQHSAHLPANLFLSAETMSCAKQFHICMSTKILVGILADFCFARKLNNAFFVLVSITFTADSVIFRKLAYKEGTFDKGTYWIFTSTRTHTNLHNCNGLLKIVICTYLYCFCRLIDLFVVT